MSFGFKTSWIAVRDRPPRDVAAALRLTALMECPWGEGVDRAYREGVFVTPPVRGWTLAHGRRDMHTLLAAEENPDLVAWVARLSRELGEVQYFVNERGWSHHGWIRAVDGEILRAFMINDGGLPIFLGEITEAERALGKGLRSFAHENWRDWTEEQWDAWHEEEPGEFDTLRLAGRWSLDPTRLPEDEIGGSGLYGSAGSAD